MKLRKITWKNLLVILAGSFAATLTAFLLGFQPSHRPAAKPSDKQMIREAAAALDALCEQDEDKC